MAAELIHEFEPEIETFTLVPSDGGRFEVIVNGKLIFSKLALYRHANPGEITQALRQALMEGL